MSENIRFLIDHIESLCNLQNRNNIMCYLIARQNEIYNRLGLMISDNENLKKIIDLSIYYKDFLNRIVDEYDVLEWDEEYIENSVFNKSLLLNENEFFDGLLVFNPIEKTKFLKPGYDIRFFCILIKINQTQSIHLYQQVTTSYNTSFKAFIPLFDERYNVQLMDYSKGFSVGKNFDFCMYFNQLDRTTSFSIVHDRKAYEKFFNYIEQYKQAFDVVSEFDYIDFSGVGVGSEDLWRKCYSLLNFPDLRACMVDFTRELRSGQGTDTKRALDSRGIPYSLSLSGLPIVKPQDLKQAKWVIRILRDGIAETHYLKRKGVTNKFDVI